MEPSNGNGADREMEVNLEGAIPKDMLPEFAGELSVEVHDLIADRIRGWQAEGKMVDLDTALLVLKMSGSDLPNGEAGLCAAARGVFGEEMTSEELLEFIALTLHNTCMAAGVQDPIQRERSFQEVFQDFKLNLHSFAMTVDSTTWWGRIKMKIPSLRRERRVIAAINSLLDLVDIVNDTGSNRPPVEAGDGSVEGLTRDDFKAEKQ